MLVFIEEVGRGVFLFTSTDMWSHSRYFSSTERRAHRPQVEETTGHVKAWADPAEEQWRAKVIPVGDKTETVRILYKDLGFINLIFQVE